MQTLTKWRNLSEYSVNIFVYLTLCTLLALFIMVGLDLISFFPYVNNHHTEIMNSLLPIPHDTSRRFVILLALLIIILLALLKSPQVLGKLVQHVYSRTDAKITNNNEHETLHYSQEKK